MDKKPFQSNISGAGAKRPGPWNNKPGAKGPGGFSRRPGGGGQGGPRGGAGGFGNRKTGEGGAHGGKHGGPGHRDGSGKRPGKYVSEFGQKIIDIRRVARVTSGGRRFSFSVCVVIGDKKGRVGVGMGKAGDTSLAIEKAVASARKRMITVQRTETNSIPHESKAKYSSARVVLMPAPGRGLVAGSSVRPILDLAGITNVTAKLLSGTKNKLNNAQAAIKALSLLSTPKPSRVNAPKTLTEVVTETVEAKPQT